MHRQLHPGLAHRPPDVAGPHVQTAAHVRLRQPGVQRELDRQAQAAEGDQHPQWAGSRRTTAGQPSRQRGEADHGIQDTGRHAGTYQRHKEVDNETVPVPSARSTSAPAGSYGLC